MALFLALYPRLAPEGFQRTAVNRHPALWSPDLPPASTLRVPASGCLACFTTSIVTDGGAAFRPGAAISEIWCRHSASPFPTRWHRIIQTRPLWPTQPQVDNMTQNLRSGGQILVDAVRCSDGRKVRTPQSRVTVNDRPPKAARYKARNRATETSLWDRGGRKPLPASQRVKRGNLHPEQFQIGTR